jgi:hypothetical protein
MTLKHGIAADRRIGLKEPGSESAPNGKEQSEENDDRIPEHPEPGA